MDYTKIINVAFCLAPKIGGEVILLPACDKQQGKHWNYIVVCCSDEYNGLYRYKADIIPHLRCWDNNGKKCYVIPISEVEKFKELNQLDNKVPLGKYILRVIKKIRRENGR